MLISSTKLQLLYSELNIDESLMTYKSKKISRLQYNPENPINGDAKCICCVRVNLEHRGEKALRIHKQNMTNNATGKNWMSKTLSLQKFLNDALAVPANRKKRNLPMNKPQFVERTHLN